MKINIIFTFFALIFIFLSCKNQTEEPSLANQQTGTFSEQKIPAQNCYQGKLSYYNGVNDTTKNINSANVKIETAKVETIDTTFNLTATISCDSDGNNDPHNITVLVFLPAEVNLISYFGPDSCLVVSSPELYSNTKIQAGYVHFSKDKLDRSTKEGFNIMVKTSLPKKANASNPNFSVFVHNQSPEINYKDNFWSWK